MTFELMKTLFPIALVFFLVGCDAETSNPPADTSQPVEQSSNLELVMAAADDGNSSYEVGDELDSKAGGEVYPIEANELAIKWDELVPVDYRPEALIAKYQDQLAAMADDDPKAVELYGKIQAELDNAPLNEAIKGKEVRLAGFIAPLSMDEKISEFLLVPYFGACIHVPPPPLNQTVYIKTRPDQAIDAESAYDPVWVQGIIQTEGKSTDIGQAGYRIMEAGIDPYEE